MIVEHGLISFLQKFDEQPFLVKMGGKEYKIGEGEPTFTVKFNYPGASTQALCSAPTSPLTALAFRSCSRRRESGV